ncbi:glycerol-3-phosphate acyltransferase, chloroplastic [Cyclospora cayetanensis]|uniref:Glycerol-3-phosphate acyltransferase, chloroplastic n=1 Tax=Cyclospora cayetanensis TaxID=88456 RepID=A0A6P6RPI0_9EIME|nr:glycerol-3-phosphate acyltransferase, chloroplastic [Cyclospora cayetanensis]
MQLATLSGRTGGLPLTWAPPLLKPPTGKLPPSPLTASGYAAPSFVSLRKAQPCRAQQLSAGRATATPPEAEAEAAGTTVEALFPFGSPPGLSATSTADPRSEGALEEAKTVIEKEMWRLYAEQQQLPQQQQKRLSKEQVEQLVGFSKDYCNSAKVSGKVTATQCVAKLTSILQQCMRCSSHVFTAFSAAQHEPLDFARWALGIWEPLIDVKRSKLPVHETTLAALSAHLKAGGNAVLLSNHQTEPDPLLARFIFQKKGFKDLYDALTAVAGYRVRSDLLSVPFSMSCNMICVHSKKHLSSGAESLGQQRRENVLAMQALQQLLQAGGALIWVAPSGGRDRANEKGVYVQPDLFDSKTVQSFALLARKAKEATGVETLFLPMAVYTAPICPPPKAVAKELGEVRTCNFSPIGLAIGEPLPADLAPPGLTAAAQEQTNALYASIASFP